MLFVNIQECGCNQNQKIIELVDEVKAIKEIVVDIKNFLHRQPHPIHDIPSALSCQTPPPLPPPTLPTTLRAKLVLSLTTLTGNPRTLDSTPSTGMIGKTPSTPKKSSEESKLNMRNS